MKRLVIVAMVVAAGVGAAWSAQQEEVSVAAMPPVVVKTVPQSGDTKVDPATTEIKVTFSKKMTTGENYSWVGDDRVLGRRQAALARRRPHVRAAGETPAGQRLRGLAQLDQGPQLQGLARAIRRPVSARLRDR